MLSEIIVDEANELFCVEEGVLFEKQENASRLRCVGTTVYAERFGARRVLLYYPKDKKQAQYIVPEDVYIIREGAFEGTQVRHVKLPEDVIEIGQRAFADSSVESVNLPGELDMIPEEAFAGSCIREVVFHGTLTEYEKDYFVGMSIVGDGAFRDCRQLRRVTLGENVRRIGVGAFENCTRLYDARLLNEEYVLAGSVFKNCTSLREINLSQVPPRDNFEGSGLLLLHTRMRRDVWERSAERYPMWSQLPWHTRVVFESNGSVISLNTVLLSACILLTAAVAIVGTWIIRKRKRLQKKEKQHE